MIIDVEGLPEEKAIKVIEQAAAKSRIAQMKVDMLFDNDEFCDVLLDYVANNKNK